MQQPFHKVSEGDLQKAWKWVLAICAIYGAVLIILVGSMIYDLIVDAPLTNAAQTKSSVSKPVARSCPATRFADRKVN